MTETGIEQYNQQQRRNLAKGVQIFFGAIAGGVILLNNLISLLRGNATIWPLLINSIWIGTIIVFMPTLVDWWYRLSGKQSEIVMPDKSAAMAAETQVDDSNVLSIIPPGMLARYDADERNDKLITIVAWGMAIAIIVFEILYHKEGSAFGSLFALLIPLISIIITHYTRKLREAGSALAESVVTSDLY